MKHPSQIFSAGIIKVRRINALSRMIFWAICVLFFKPIQAQQNIVQFEQFTEEHGLSQNTIMCICRDHQGFLWTGTYEGLDRYDGYNFKTYKRDVANPNSLNSNRVRAIYEDRNGDLWIGTDGGGLNKFIRETETFIHYVHHPADPNSLSCNRINCICEDRYGDLWIGTDSGGLNRFDRKTRKFIRYQSETNNPHSLCGNTITHIIEDEKGCLWIATYEGLNQYDRVRDHFHRHLASPAEPQTYAMRHVSALHEDHEGTLWIGSFSAGLGKYNRKTRQMVRYQHNPDNPNSLSHNLVTVIHEDRRGQLWIGTKDGLNRFDPKTQRFIRHKNIQNNPHSIGGNVIHALHEDPPQFGDALWIGGDASGLNKLQILKKPFWVYRHDATNDQTLSGDFILSVCADPIEPERILWIGTMGNGLNKLDQLTGLCIRYNHPHQIGNLDIRAIRADRNGWLWLGTEHGISKFNPGSEKLIRYPYSQTDSTKLRAPSVFSIYRDNGGTIWVCGWDMGLAKYDRTHDSFFTYLPEPHNPHSISSQLTWCVFEDADEDGQILWVGTHDGGLNKFDRRTQKFTHFKHDPDNPHSISHNTVLNIHPAEEKNCLWIGTNGGLDKFNKVTETFTHYTEKEGLPNNSIQSVLFDNSGRLWIGTARGLVKFDPKTEKFRIYKPSDGLQGNSFFPNACSKITNGEMVFGGLKGLNIFHPDSIKDDKRLPNVVITDFSIFNQPVPVTDDKSSPLQKSITETREITLSYKQNIFTLGFSALHFTSPKDNRYAYKMEGFEKTWNYTDASKRFATYTNLDPGEYIFKVKAANNDGIWNEDGTALKIKIMPPFWQTWWFRLILILTTLLLVTMTYRVRTNAIRKRNKELEEINNELKAAKALSEAASRVKSDFLANISHEFRTPMNGIIGMTNAVLNLALTSEQRESLAIVRHSADSLLEILNRILIFSEIESSKLKIHPQEFNLRELMEDVVTFLIPLANEKGLELQSEIHNQTPVHVIGDPDYLKQVLINLAKNAIKFTDKGRIVIQVCPKENNQPNGKSIQLSFSVTDTGIGISEDKLETVFEKFSQADSSFTRKFGGVGIGLTLSKKLIELMHGKIWVESVVEKGSTFHFTIMLDVAQPPAETKSANLNTQKCPKKTNVPLRILLAEDNPVNQKVTTKILEKWGHAVTIAENGKKTIDMLEKEDFDLILMDIQMPEMDGLEATRQIRNTASPNINSNIAIIALTAHALKTDQQRCLQAGMDDFLTKPIDVSMLLKILQDFCKGKYHTGRKIDMVNERV